MEDNVLEFLVRALNNHQGRSASLTNSSLLSGLKPKHKKYIKKNGGLRNFITRHPNDLAIVDELVIALRSPIPQHISSSPITNSYTPTIKEDKFTPPSKAAVESIKKDIEASNDCMLCFDNMEIYAIGVCFHPICFKCSTKLRVLCDDKHCPQCRTTLTQVIFTTQLATIAEINTNLFIKEQKYGLLFENSQIQNKHSVLLEHRCPKNKCDMKYNDFEDLKTHLRLKHGEYFCDLCVRQCKIFTHERETYSSSELREHEGSGDVNSSNSNKGHPKCPFCDVRYLDTDELFRHLQQHHISCHLCHEASHTFYCDNYEIWNEHHCSSHFTCHNEECYGDINAVFSTEKELKDHNKERHRAGKGSPVKRGRDISIDFSFNQRPDQQLLSARSPSSGFRLTSMRGYSMSSDDLRCTGRIVNLTSFYGFVERDDYRGRREDNIFFNHQAVGLDSEEDLIKHFILGERVQVLAVKGYQNHLSKWRAVDIQKLTEASIDSMSVMTRTESEASFSTCDDRMDSLDNLTFEGDFPSLPGDRSIPFPSTAFPPQAAGVNKTNWSTVAAKCKKPVKVPLQTNESTPAGVRTFKKASSKELIGSGVIHNSLDRTYGFITNPNNQFEDNIYFSLTAYRDGSKEYVEDLTKSLKIGEKVFYELEKPGQTTVVAKSKYKAVRVWKPYHQINQPVTNNSRLVNEKYSLIPSLTMENSRQPKHDTSKKNKPVTQAVNQENKHKNKENKVPVFTLPSNQAEIENLGPTHTTLNNKNSIMELDAFQSPKDDFEHTTKTVVTNETEDIFHNVLVELVGGNKDEVLFDFDQELTINEVKLNQIAFVKFSLHEKPKIHSILLPTKKKTDKFMHKQFFLPCKSGFNLSALNTLARKGVLLTNDDTLYYVNNSSFYITLRKNEAGRIIQLFLHTPFHRS